MASRFNGYIMNDKKALIPKYAIVPIIFYCLAVPSYFLVRFLTEGRSFYDASFFLDEKIPFLPIFIWIYVLAYLQWFIGYFAVMRSNETTCKTYFGAEFIGKLTCVLIFALIPTTMVRPELSGSGLTNDLMQWMYSIDSPDNLFPSIHCMESWLVARGLMETKAPRAAKILMWVFSILVFMSVVFVKQHVVIDIAGGIAVAELAIYLSKRLDMPGFYTAIEKRLCLS